MSLNIKNQGTHRRAQELARLWTPLSPSAWNVFEKKRNTGAVVKRLLKIGHECASLPVLDNRSPEQMLYKRDYLNDGCEYIRSAVHP